VSTTALARLEGFHSIRQQRKDNFADSFVEGRLENAFLGTLQIFWVWS
jgi:hypothetical protein